MSRPTATASRPTYVYWDMETVPPSGNPHPARQVAALYAAAESAGLPPVHTVVAYPSIPTLHRLIKAEVFDDFEEEDEVQYWAYRDIEGDPLELRLWITEWAAVDLSPYACPYCGQGRHWKRDNRLLAKHVKRHGMELLQERGVEVPRQYSKTTLSPTQLALHVSASLVLRTMGSDPRVPRWLAARRKVFEWSVPFRKKESLERLLRAGGQRAAVVMPSPSALTPALVRDLRITFRRVIAGNICVVSEDPQYREVLEEGRARGWFVVVASRCPALRDVADAVLDPDDLLAAGLELQPPPVSEDELDEEVMLDPDNVEDWWIIDRNTSRGGYYNENINPRRNIWKTYK